MITTADKRFLAQKEISEERFETQLEALRKGFPYLRLQAAASIEKGIWVCTDEEIETYGRLWDNYLEGNHHIVKFVPASGAASRMFKDLFSYMYSPDNTPPTGFVQTFFFGLTHFAFFSALCKAVEQRYGKSLETLLAEQNYKGILHALLSDEGLAYGALPKGLLRFHTDTAGARTPTEEHLAEAALYAAPAGGTANVHFTVSSEHLPLFQQLVINCQPTIEARYGMHLDVRFSEQKPSTDTIAVDADGRPLRTDDGALFFRPGGHGALIENLNDLEADVVFIKNIDNVVPDRLKASTVRYKKLLGGVLVSLQKQIFAYLETLDSGAYSMDELLTMLQFVQKKLCLKNPAGKFLEDTELAIYLRQKLNRPLRVCGMVKNVGEPGGGPFLACNADGTISLQIVESSQVDFTKDRALFEGGTHFNPVDLVCAVRDYRGQKFNLPAYVDAQTGFISEKSRDGKILKALELPGLWNGAMSDWNTVFVEVPLSTFNPVKTVNDLLRPQHQAAG